MEGDDITGKRREGALEEGGSSAKRLKCSIEPEAFSCDACARPLWLPIFLVNRSSTILRCVCIDLDSFDNGRKKRLLDRSSSMNLLLPYCSSSKS